MLRTTGWIVSRRGASPTPFCYHQGTITFQKLAAHGASETMELLQASKFHQMPALFPVIRLLFIAAARVLIFRSRSSQIVWTLG